MVHSEAEQVEKGRSIQRSGCDTSRTRIKGQKSIENEVQLSKKNQGQEVMIKNYENQDYILL